MLGRLFGSKSHKPKKSKERKNSDSAVTMKITKKTSERLIKLQQMQSRSPRGNSFTETSSPEKKDSSKQNKRYSINSKNDLKNIEAQRRLEKEEQRKQQRRFEMINKSINEKKETKDEDTKVNESEVIKQQSSLSEESRKINKIQHSRPRKRVKVKVKLDNEYYKLYDYYKPIKSLGKGAYATVIEVEDTRTGDKLAIKKNKGVFDQLSDAKRILREIKLLAHFRHPNVMPLITVIPPDSHERDDFNDVYLVIPKMDTNLRKILRNARYKLSTQHKQYFIYQILLGLQYIHSCGVYHRDLKPENILVNLEKSKLRITDFGLSRGVTKENNELLTQYVVTRWYRAPEVICNAGRYDECIDIWAVGCMMAELWLRKPLFRGENYMDQLNEIFNIRGKPGTFEIKSSKAKSQFGRMAPKKPQDLRRHVPGIENDASALDLLEKMLNVDPKFRITVNQAIKHPWLSKMYREKDEILSNSAHTFDISFEYEQKMNTLFGVRHLMFSELTNFRRNKMAKVQKLRNEKAQTTRHSKIVSKPPDRIKSARE